MCGIVGLYAKNENIEQSLGLHVAAMLSQMGERGPDSAGVAFYSDPSHSPDSSPAQRTDGNKPQVASKLTIQHDDPQQLQTVLDGISSRFNHIRSRSRGTHLVIESQLEATELEQLVREQFPQVRVMSAGERIEIYKEKGHPDQFVKDYALHEVSASHALAHTRMATESAITTSHSHPFSTGQDLCLVHNGSLSNHNRLREQLIKNGIRFDTDNDSEVAAGFLAWRLSQGDSLREALQAALKQLDGFYTFAIGTRDGFAVLRDPIACKPAVLAETDDWVAMSSEYRAIAQLPGASHAHVWEPVPAQIYTWEGKQAKGVAA